MRAWVAWLRAAGPWRTDELCLSVVASNAGGQSRAACPDTRPPALFAPLLPLPPCQPQFLHRLKVVTAGPRACHERQHRASVSAGQAGGAAPFCTLQTPFPGSHPDLGSGTQVGLGIPAAPHTCSEKSRDRAPHHEAPF